MHNPSIKSLFHGDLIVAFLAYKLNYKFIPYMLKEADTYIPLFN